MKRELLTLFLGMPEDLQQTCISSPARRELLLSLQLTAEQASRLEALVKGLQIAS